MLGPKKNKKKQKNEQEAQRRVDQRSAPSAESDRKPDSPTELTKPSWTYVARKTAREFSSDQCTDLAAALTYYAVLALFPAMIALLSLVSLVGQGEETVDTLLGIVRDIGPASVADTIEPTLQSLATSQAGGIGFVLGLAGALFSASGYVNAFSRAMNRIYEIGEGRPIWKLRPVMLLVTIASLLLVATAALILIVTGPVAQAVGDAIGLGSAAVTTWSIAKWPVLLIIVVLVVALLYWSTPNVQQPKFRWLSAGALFAIVVWLLASVAFGFYVANFSNYDATYGSLAGAVVFLLWLWLTNIALLFGAELDAELERGRQLQGGIPAEETIQLPPRDTRNIDKAEEKHAQDVEKGRAIRLSHGEEGDPDDVAGARTGRRD